MRGEYAALKGLQSHPGYKILQALWLHEHAKIVESMRKAARKNQESSWRFYAGQQEGFDLAVTHLDRALTDMERQEENVQEQKTADQLLREIKGDQEGG